jgi:hypothetical protein
VRRLLAVGLTVANVATAASSDAQLSSPAAERLRRVPGSSAAKTDGVTLPAITVKADPTNIQVIDVPVLSDLIKDGQAKYSVTLNCPGASLLSAGQGAIERRVDGGMSHIVVTVVLPANMGAGTSTIATVHLSRGTLSRSIPLNVFIDRLRSVRIALVGDRPVMRFNERATLTIAVENAGNSPDTIGLRLTAPKGWGVDDVSGVRLAVVPANRSVEWRYRIRSPHSGATGDFLLQAAALSGARLLGKEELTVTVADDDATDSPYGPTLSFSVSSASSSATVTVNSSLPNSRAPDRAAA